ncbi:cobalt ECF transporter T component CbiQ [Desulfovibrio aerotolerans]|uniref:Cobalt ECF transporter T component CbiQ n=1 Tax=Solidesulfovibrio aerotolerans TaxID=295255 RepID=A0A7C9IKE5_9BACT|nr:cobalt ECF transporter T component CbiQ [Solidesulfovibrio aerotolerans]MYL82126.1 cobalt ECF transporter T component CbiQ [Solidesulfovibrio aerotolerans]
MIDEHFAGGTSPIHALDPRYRLAACLLLSLVAALARTPQTPLLILGAGLVLTVLSGVSAKLVLRRAAAVNLFIIFLWLFLPVSTPGMPLWQGLGLTVTREGVALAGLVTLKANAVFLCVLSLMGTIPAPALGRALTALGAPAKFSFLFVFTYRYLHVIAEEYGRLVTAARLRGFVPATDGRTYRTYAALVAMVLVRSYDRSQRVYQAMLLRGFTGVFPCLDRFAAGRRDVLFLGCVVALAAGAVWIEWLAGRGNV